MRFLDLREYDPIDELLCEFLQKALKYKSFSDKIVPQTKIEACLEELEHARRVYNAQKEFLQNPKNGRLFSHHISQLTLDEKIRKVAILKDQELIDIDFERRAKKHFPNADEKTIADYVEFPEHIGITLFTDLDSNGMKEKNGPNPQDTYRLRIAEIQELQERTINLFAPSLTDAQLNKLHKVSEELASIKAYYESQIDHFSSPEMPRLYHNPLLRTDATQRTKIVQKVKDKEYFEAELASRSRMYFPNKDRTFREAVMENPAILYTQVLDEFVEKTAQEKP